MNQLAQIIELGPQDESERLWRGALKAYEQAPDSLIALCEALNLGIRAAEILAFLRLHPVRDQFPATIMIQLEEPAPAVDVRRDAVRVPKSLTFGEILDMLSEDSLECVAPQLHRGWEDRRFSCARSRKTARETLGVTLDGETREKLLVLSAYHNRIFRLPPPIRIETATVLDAFPTLVRLVEGLKSAAVG